MIKNESSFSSVSRMCSPGVSYYIVVLVQSEAVASNVRERERVVQCFIKGFDRIFFGIFWNGKVDLNHNKKVSSINQFGCCLTKMWPQNFTSIFVPKSREEVCLSQKNGGIEICSSSAKHSKQWCPACHHSSFSSF